MKDLSWLPPTIVALSTLIVAIISAIRSGSNGVKVDAVASTVGTVAEKVESVLEKAVEIHSATNGTLSAVTSKRDVLLEKVEGLERALIALQESGTLAATTAVQAATDVREAQAAVPPEKGATA